MKKSKIIFGACLSSLLAIGALTGCSKGNGKDTYDENGRLILNLKNAYFNAWDGTDMYTDIINEQFGVTIKPSNYDYNYWDDQVNTAIHGNNLTDVIHYNLKAYNFGSTYLTWIEDEMIKPLPTNMSKWPNIKKMLDNTSNIDALKVDGKLYGIPVANDISNPSKDFSNFTYIYRRDIVKQIDEANKNTAGYKPIYREGDVYTWDEFLDLLAAFRSYINNKPNKSAKECVMADESWGFPSPTNFYKDVPHCFMKDENGKAINAFTSDKYIAGLNVAKGFVESNYYLKDQYNYDEGTAKKQYTGGLTYILYDNFSLTNYSDLRTSFKQNQEDVDLDDGTAFLKVKGPDGKFALEGTENWFGITMFNYDISDNKMHKILDIMDFLLSEKGTRLAVYGKEGYDYSMVNGKVVLSDLGWEKVNGKYKLKNNGARYLRYMATLGNDTKTIDPTTETEDFEILSAWIKEMQQAHANNNLRVVQEPADIDWMSTKSKDDYTESMLYDANTAVLEYCFTEGYTLEKYLKEFNNSHWTDSLNEINQKLGK